MRCQYDTDGDGDCPRCARRPEGCFMVNPPIGARLVSSSTTERELAVIRTQELMGQAYWRGDKTQGRWHERCLGELEAMTDEEFAERYKDVED